MHDGDSVKALVLFSGGLDSQLAVCLLRNAGVAVQAIAFTSPFFDGTLALEAAQGMDVPLEEVDFTTRMVRALQDGPTFDESSDDISVACQGAMIRYAAELMQDLGCDFLATGDVLDQRVPIQSREIFDDIDAQCERSGWVLRPLSARRLPETFPEQKGWVDREKLLDLEGAGRKVQLELATQYALSNLPEPGVHTSRLSDPSLAVRLRDLRAHEGLEGRRALALLRSGRHFRLGPVTKLIVGRNEQENLDLQGQVELYELVLQVRDATGAVGVLPIIAPEDQVRTAAAVCARYSDLPQDEKAIVRIRSSRGTRTVEVMPAPEDQLDLLRI
jgi:hypothetical protein